MDSREPAFRRRAILACASAATGLAYYAIAHVSLAARTLLPSVSPVWPAAGVALAAALTWGCGWSCPAVFAASLGVGWTLGLPPVGTLAMAFANALEVFGAGRFLTSTRLDGHSFYQPRDFAVYALITLASCSAASAIAVTAFYHTGTLGSSTFLFAFVSRVLAHWTGMLTVSPLLLLWRHHPRLSLRPVYSAEGLAMGACAAVICWLLFFGGTATSRMHAPLSYLLLPLALWPAVRHGLRETATMIMFITAAALWGTVHDYGPFVAGGRSLSLTMLQGFLAVQAIVAMSLASAVWRAKDTGVELDAARRRLRLVLDASPAYIAYVDRRWTYTLANETFQNWFGVPAAELLGRSVREMSGEGFHTVRPLLERAFAGASVRETITQADPAGRRHWMDVSLTPDRDPASGEVRGVVLLATDVSAQTEVERALRETEARLRIVLDHSPVYIGYVDKRGRYRMVNRNFQQWFEREPSEMIGRDTEEMLGPAFAAVEPLQRQALAGHPARQTVRAQNRKGQPRWLDISYTPDFDDDGGVRGYVITSVDVTALKESEEALRTAERQLTAFNKELERRVEQRTSRLRQVNDELESFAYTVAHDLRSPLRKMSGFSEAVLKDYEARLDPKGAQYLHRIFDASRRMGRLIDEMLSLSLVTRADMNEEEVDLSALARRIVEDLRRGEPGREVEVTIADGLTARGDAGLLEAALRNLLDNAWKFTRPKARARIEVGQLSQEPAPAFFVRDDGVGFDMSQRHKLFGTFERLHARDEFPGSGIGLATVQRVAQRHGGRVWAEGEPGKGAAFYFTLHDKSA